MIRDLLYVLSLLLMVGGSGLAIKGLALGLYLLCKR